MSLAGVAGVSVDFRWVEAAGVFVGLRTGAWGVVLEVG